MMEENNCCVMCGRIIPEGGQCCPSCISKCDNSIPNYIKKKKSHSLLKSIKTKILNQKEFIQS